MGEKTSPESFNRIKNESKAELSNEESYESKTSREYFEDWEKIALEGVVDLGVIKKSIKQAEKERKSYYERLAKETGTSVESAKRQLQEKVDGLVERSEFFVCVEPCVLEKILEEGRWKNSYEGVKSPGSRNEPYYRAVKEKEMFGFNGEIEMYPEEEYGDDYEEVWEDEEGEEYPVLYHVYDGFMIRADESPPEKDNLYYAHKYPDAFIDKNADQRPIYGYFSDEEHGAINSVGTIPPPTSVAHYGRINVKVRKERALDKATLSFSDTLDRDSICSPARKPHFTSFPISASEVFGEICLKGSGFLDRIDKTSVTNMGDEEDNDCIPYTEVQYHGQLTLGDVESIYISANNGLTLEEVKKVKEEIAAYNEKHPKSAITLIEH
ncbi:hypothetical protein KKC60_04460 [Patescibacteria group bacterium]|nr:hypothetical protein [Patescibacteria group bacterium]